MRRISSFLAISGTILLAASCAKEINSPDVQNNDKQIEISILASNKPAVETDTKTFIDGTSVKWSSTGETLKVYEVATPSEGDAITSYKTSAEGVTSDGGATMTFDVSLDDKSEGYTNFDYYAVYPSTAPQSVANVNVNSVALNTVAAQTPSASNFDASQDLLIAKPITSDSQPASLEMQFARVIAIGKMTIKNLGSSEDITKITFSAKVGDTPVNLAGRTNFNLATATPVTNYASNTQETSIILNYEGQSIKANSASGMTAYFVCYPFTINAETPGSFKVVVETATHSYEKEVNVSSATGLSLKTGKASVFAVNMDGIVGTAKSIYQKVTEKSQITDGKYLIVYEDGSLTFDGSLTTLDVSSNIKEVTIVDNAIEVLGSADNFYFTIDATAGTIQSASGYYIGRTTDANGMLTDLSTKYENTLSISDGNATVKSSGGAFLRYNKANSDKRFRYYKSSTYTSQQAIQLYKLYVPSVPKLSAPSNVVADKNGAGTIEVVWDDIAAPDGITVTYEVTCTGESNKIINTGVKTAKFTGLADGTYTVTVTAKSSDTESYLDSDPVTVEGIILGTPTLDTPTNVTVSQVSLTQISASWDAVENATSYEWELYSDSEHNNMVGTGTANTNSLSSSIDDINAVWSIAELSEGTTYYFTVVAKAAGYNDSAKSIDASFIAAPPAKGTLGNPYTASELYDIVATYKSGEGPDGTVYVQGYVVKASAPSSNAQNYYISNDGSETNAFMVYKGKGIDGADLTDANRVNNGDFVVVGGSAVNYNGNTPEFNTGSQIYTHTPKITLTFSPEAGTYNSAQSVTITSTPSDATIYYTTDGSTPTTSSSVYSSAISVSTTTTIKALAVKSGCFDSDVTSAIFTISNQHTYSCTFTSKAWANTDGDEISWTSGKDGGQLMSGRGVQVSTTFTGANATTQSSFSNVSRVVVTYSTNATKSAGNIKIQVGDNTEHELTVTVNGGTTDRTTSVDISPNETGKVKLTVNCTTNSIYVKSVDIIAD